MLVLMITLAFGSGIVSSDTCLSKHCCQQLPGIQSKVAHYIKHFGLKGFRDNYIIFFIKLVVLD